MVMDLLKCRKCGEDIKEDWVNVQFHNNFKMNGNDIFCSGECFNNKMEKHLFEKHLTANNDIWKRLSKETKK